MSSVRWSQIYRLKDRFDQRVSGPLAGPLWQCRRCGVRVLGMDRPGHATRCGCRAFNGPQPRWVQDIARRASTPALERTDHQNRGAGGSEHYVACRALQGGLAR